MEKMSSAAAASDRMTAVNMALGRCVFRYVRQLKITEMAKTQESKMVGSSS